jgi:hypothetical protein
MENTIALLRAHLITCGGISLRDSDGDLDGTARMRRLQAVPTGYKTPGGGNTPINRQPERSNVSWRCLHTFEFFSSIFCICGPTIVKMAWIARKLCVICYSSK